MKFIVNELMYMLKRLSLIYSTFKSYYYCHICVFLVYSMSVLCMSNAFVALPSFRYLSTKCLIGVHQVLECPSVRHVSDMYTLAKLK